jgi:HK97 family phage prohead protease
MSFDSFEYKTTSEYAESVKAGAINLDEAQGIVECFVAGIGNKDSVGDIVSSGAFTKSLMRRKPRVVWGHNWNDPIGKVLEIYEVGPNDRRLPLKMKMAGIGGLFARVQFNLQSEKGREAFANVAFFGEEQEWSIGYKTLRAQYDQKSQANIIHELELYEVSPVLHGANQLTGTISVKADDPYAMDPMYGPATTMVKPKPEPDAMAMQKMMETQLSEMLGMKVSVVEFDEQNVTYAKPDADGGMQKYKCPYMRDGGRFMFGAPKPVIIAPAAGVPVMPNMPMPANEPQRVMRPTQMPGIPVAIKPGTSGMVMVPLPPVQYENQPAQGPVDKNNLDKEEADLRDALLKIVKRHGRFNEDSSGVWAGYKPAAENYVAKIGVKCANCVFYEGGSTCKIIAIPVEPEGKCRFAVIPKGVVVADPMAKKQYDMESGADEQDYVEELEEKYPGELAVAAVRGALKRRRGKNSKYKMLSEYGSSDDKGDMPYVIPVTPNEAFAVKQALDPIFDYYRAETFVDIDGIIIKSGASFDMIEAVDNALQNVKKKALSKPEEKSLGYRIGRAVGSRLADRPSIGRGGKGRRRGLDVDLPTGGNPGSRKPTGSNFDPDNDGWVDEGTTRPRFVGARTPQPNAAAARTVAPQQERRSVADRLASSRDLNRHGLPNENPDMLDPREAEKRREFDGISNNWLKSGSGWKSKPRKEGDRTSSPDLLRGRELGENQARLSWNGSRTGNLRRPRGFDEQDRSSDDYFDWYYGHVNRMGSFLSALNRMDPATAKRRISPDEKRGIEESIIDSVASKVPDLSGNRQEDERLKMWLEMNGFDGRLSSGQRNKEPKKFTERAVVPFDPYGDDFDPDNPYGDENEPFQFGGRSGEDFYDMVIEEFLGPEAPRDRMSSGRRQDDERATDEELLRDYEEQVRLGKAGPPTDEELEQEYQQWVNKFLDERELDEPIRPSDKELMAEYERMIEEGELRPPTDEELEAEYQDRLRRGEIDESGEDARNDIGRLSSGYRSYLAQPEERRTPRQVQKYDGYVAASLSSGKRKPSAPANADEQGELILKGSPKLQEIYDRFSEEVIAALEAAMQDPTGVKWEIPWRTTSAPRNPVTEKPYTGIRYNLVLLNAVKMSRGYDTSKWAGAAQWRRRNQMLRGDRSAVVEIDEERGVDILVPQVVDGRKTGNYYVRRVYNVADVKGLPESEYKKEEPINPDQAAKELDQAINNEIRPKIKTGSDDGAFYRPSEDVIYMPDFESFVSAERYYSTLLHETTHWTGHPTRNDRPQRNLFGTPEYAYEELIAEIGASQALSLFGLTLGPREDHVQYLKSWVSLLREDKDALRRAVDEAQEAVDAMLEKSPTMRRFYGVQESEVTARREGFRRRKIGVELPMAEGMEGSERIKGGKKAGKMPTSGPVSGYPTEMLSSGRRLSAGQRDSLPTHASGLSREERDIYEPFGASQRGRDGRVMDLGGRLSSGAKRGPIKDRNGKGEIERTPDDVSVREIFDFSFDPTDQQRDILDTLLAVVFGKTGKKTGVVSVSAGAGTGKTTTLKTVMKGIDRLFDFGIFDRLKGDAKDKAIADKKDYLDKFYPEMIKKAIKDAKISGKTKLANLSDDEFSTVIKSLQSEAKKLKGFYIVFGKKNEEDADVEFPENTAASTLQKLAWWGLRRGIGDELYGRGMRKKIALGMLKKRKHPKSKAGPKKVTFVDAQGNEVEFDGMNPGWRELGYKMVTNGISVDKYLDLEKRAEEIATRLRAGEQIPDAENPFAQTVNGQRYLLTNSQLGSVLFRALSNFLLSGDDEPSAKHFMNTKVQEEQLQYKINNGITVAADDISYPEISQLAVDAIKKLWDDMRDDNSSLLPHQGAVEKLWALTRPSLKSSPGMIQHASKEQVRVPQASGLLKRAEEEAKRIFNGKIDDFKIAEAMASLVIEPGDLDGKKAKDFTGYVVISANRSPNGQWTMTVAKPYGADPKDPAALTMIDEAQDMNEVMLRVLQDNADEVPLVMVGDPRQAIMAWRGAMDVLSATDADYGLALTESFRYGPLIAHMANIILAQGNLDDLDTKGERTFAHVVGRADDLIKKLFTFEGIGGEDKLQERVSHIQHVFQTELAELAAARPELGIKKDSDGLYKLTELRSRDKTAFENAAREFRDMLTTRAQGTFIGPDDDVDAILTATNAGIIDAAIQFALSPAGQRSRVGGKPTAVVIPASRWKEMVDLLRHVQYVQQQDKSKWTKPEPSSLIGDEWEWDKIKGMTNSSQHGPLRALLNLVTKPIAGEDKPFSASTWLKMFQETRTDTPLEGAPLPIQFIKSRKELRLTDLVDHPERNGDNLAGADLAKIAARTGKGQGQGTGDQSKSREARYNIIPDPLSADTKRVYYTLDFSEDDAWNGRVFISGGGAAGAKQDKQRNTQGGVGQYHDDIQRAVQKLIDDGVITASEARFMPEISKIKTRDGESRAEDAFVIQGSGRTEAERNDRTAFIVSRIGTMVRQSASGQVGDMEIMTATTAKGKEWDRVRLWKDFTPPQKPFKWDTASPEERERQVAKTLDFLTPLADGRMKKKAISQIYGIPMKDLDRYSRQGAQGRAALRDLLKPLVEERLKTTNAIEGVDYREKLNLHYVAITRAKRALDMGAAMYKIYLQDANEVRKYEKSIEEGLGEVDENGNPRILPGAKKPSYWNLPKSYADRADDDPIFDPDADGGEPIGDLPTVDETPEQPKKGRGRPKAEEDEDIVGGPQFDDDEDEDSGPSDNIDLDSEDDDGDEASQALSSGRRAVGGASPRPSATGRTRVGEPERTLSSGVGPRLRERGEAAGRPAAMGGRSGRMINRLSSGNRNLQVPSYLSGLGDEIDDEDVARAANVWRGIRNTGIPLTMTGAESGAERQQKFDRAMKSVGSQVKQGGQVTVGDVSKNDPEDAASNTWMLPVSRLMETLRVPLNFDVERDESGAIVSTRATQTRSINADELATMLGLPPQEAQKLRDPQAGISHDDVRRLVAAIANSDDFPAWQYFGSVSFRTAGRDAVAQRGVIGENMNRRLMRDRFIIETFGEDAYPHWYDRDEGQYISPEEYADLGEVSPSAKFRAFGSFERSAGEPTRTPFSGAEVEIMTRDYIDAMRGDEGRPTPITVSKAEGAEIRSSYPLDSLLDHLGIARDENWTEELRKRMQAAFDTDKVGLSGTNPTERRDWQRRGIPTSVVREMIRTGMIDSAATVWGDEGLDSQIRRTTNNVYEALIDFINKNAPTGKAPTTRLKDEIAGASNLAVTLPRAASRKNRTYSANNPNENLVSQDAMQAMVDRLNEKLGTNFTIDDVFSDEQLRAADERLRGGVTSWSKGKQT